MERDGLSTGFVYDSSLIAAVNTCASTRMCVCLCISKCEALSVRLYASVLFFTYLLHFYVLIIVPTNALTNDNYIRLLIKFVIVSNQLSTIIFK